MATSSATTVIITGASKGIGKAIALRLAADGHRVVVSSRDQAAVDVVAAEITAAGGTALAVACHVGKPEQCEALVARTTAHFGGVDVLINNAATNPYYGGLSRSEGDTFDRIMNVNVKAPMLLANLCYPHFKAAGGGVIVNVASVEGLRPSNGLGMYSMSKAALIMLSKSQAKEWGRHNIRSNALCPGLVQTKFSEALWQDEQLLRGFEAELPLQRMGQPEEMVGLAVFLATDASKYCTGGTFTADGGYLLGPRGM